MIDFVRTFICVVVAVVLFLFQKVLSSRKVAWLGGIMPILTIILSVGLIDVYKRQPYIFLQFFLIHFICLLRYLKRMKSIFLYQVYHTNYLNISYY